MFDVSRKYARCNILSVLMGEEHFCLYVTAPLSTTKDPSLFLVSFLLTRQYGILLSHKPQLRAELPFFYFSKVTIKYYNKIFFSQHLFLSLSILSKLSILFLIIRIKQAVRILIYLLTYLFIASF